MAYKKHFKDNVPITLQDIYAFVSVMTPVAQRDMCYIYGINIEDIGKWERADISELSTNRPLNIYLRTLDKNRWLLDELAMPTFKDAYKIVQKHYPKATVYELAQIVGGGAQNGPRWLEEDDTRIRPTIQRNIKSLLAIEKKDGKKGLDQFIKIAKADADAMEREHRIKIGS